MKKRMLTLAVSSAMLGAVTQVQAAGFQLAEYSATGLSRAFAGEAAVADNASAQGRNPAMMSYLEGTQLSIGAIYVMPDVDVKGDMTVSAPALGIDEYAFNADATDVADDALVPNFYLTTQIDESWIFGVAINSNYGLKTQISADHNAAIFGNETSVTTVEFNPNIAYRINESVSVGGGVRVVYGEGKISASTPQWIEQLPLPAEVVSALPASGTELKGMEGDDVGYGWKAGVSWQLNTDHRLGLSYHSGVDLKLEGQASGLSYTGGQNVQIDGYLPLELPATAELASYHQLSENWIFHGSVNWTQWKVFDELVAYFPGDVKPVGDLNADLVKEEHFKDNWRFALGSTYQLTNDWSLRAGMALDKTAVDDEYRTATIPDSDRLWFSAGTEYQITPKLALDFAATYIKAIGDAPITEDMTLLDLAQINYQAQASGQVWLVGMQLSYTL